MEVARPGRGVRPSHAFRVPAGGGHATKEMDGRRLPVGPAAIGPVEAKEGIDVRPGVMGLTLETERAVGSIDHRRVTVARGRPWKEDRHVARHEAGLVEEANEDTEPSHARPSRPPIILLHAAEIGPISGPGRLAPHGTNTLLGRRHAPAGHGPSITVGRLIGEPRAAPGEEAVAVQAETTMPVGLIPEAAKLMPVRLAQGR